MEGNISENAITKNSLLRNTHVKLLLITGAVYFFLKYMVPLVAPVLLAILFVTIFGPFLKKMGEKCRIPRQVGTAFLLTGFLCFLITFCKILFFRAGEWLTGWTEGLQDAERQIGEILHTICGYVGRFLPIASENIEKMLINNLRQSFEWLQTNLIPEILAQSPVYIKGAVRTGGFLLCFLIAALLLAKDYDTIMNRLIDREECHMFLEIFCGIIHYLATFIKAQLVILFLISGISMLVLAIAGISGAAFFGLLAGLMDALPFIGTGIVLVPLGLSQLFAGAFGKAAVCVILYVCCIILRQVLEPKLIGSRVGVPPVVILLFVYAGIKLFGLPGIIEGPLGYIIIKEVYEAMARGREETSENAEERSRL